MDLRGWLATDVLTWILALVRISGLLVFAPFFGSRNIPMQVKAGFALLVSVLLVPALPQGIAWRPDWSLYLGAVGCELLVGIAFGLAAATIFSSLQLAGQLVGQQMSISLANVIDPVSETEVSVVGEYKFFFGISLFLLLGGHRSLLRSLAGSFERVPIGGARPGAGVAEIMGDMFGESFALAVQLSAPVVAALFLATVGLAFVARTMPQMNVFVVGFPLQVGMGLVLMALLLPVTAGVVERMTASVPGILDRLTEAMGREG